MERTWWACKVINGAHLGACKVINGAHLGARSTMRRAKRGKQATTAREVVACFLLFARSR